MIRLKFQAYYQTLFIPTKVNEQINKYIHI